MKKENSIFSLYLGPFDYFNSEGTNVCVFITQMKKEVSIDLDEEEDLSNLCVLETS